MKYQIHTEPDYDLESLEILSDLYNGETMEKKIQAILERNEGRIKEEELELLFRETGELFRHMGLHMDLTGGSPQDKESAGLLFGEQEELGGPPVIAVYLYDQMLRHGINNRIRAIYSYLTEDYIFEKEPPEIGDGDDWFRWIDATAYSSTLKYAILRLYHGFEQYYAYYRRIVSEASSLIRDKLDLFQSKIEPTMAYVSEGVDKVGALFFKENAHIHLMDDIHYAIRPLLSIPNGVAFSGSFELVPQIRVGVSYFEMSRLVENAKADSEKLSEFLKILSDHTKLSILQILKTETCFGGQLAERLNLTNATISYHMTALMRRELVFMEKENNRIYYRLNTRKIAEYLEWLRRTLL